MEEDIGIQPLPQLLLLTTARDRDFTTSIFSEKEAFLTEIKNEIIFFSKIFSDTKA